MDANTKPSEKLVVPAVVLPNRYFGFDRVTGVGGKKEHVCHVGGTFFDCPTALFAKASKSGLLRKATAQEVKEGRAIFKPAPARPATDAQADLIPSDEDEGAPTT